MPSNSLSELRGVRALVTGGARGLGFGIVSALAEWGAHVALLDRSSKEVEEACRALKAKKVVVGVEADVIDEVAVGQAVSSAIHELGGLDLLINNAGVLSVRPVIEMELAEWRRILDVNATGTFLMSREVARHMIATGIKGSIISIASIGGKIGDPSLAHYCASKFAVVGFTQALARELGPHGITVNAICPGVVDTPMIHDLAAKSGIPVSRMLQSQVVKRMQEPREIALAIAFLHRTRSITGQAINVDGGTVFH